MPPWVVIALSWRWMFEGDTFTGARQLHLLNFPACPWLVEDSSCNLLAGLQPAARRLLILLSQIWGFDPRHVSGTMRHETPRPTIDPPAPSWWFPSIQMAKITGG